MSCPCCGHSLVFDCQARQPVCMHCNYPAPPDNKNWYGVTDSRRNGAAVNNGVARPKTGPATEAEKSFNG